MGKKLINPLLEVVNKNNMLINPYIFESKIIYISCSPTAGFGVGINVSFASGTVTVDWKDGSSPQNFTSGTEIIHTYTSAGNYIIEISGNVENITQLRADNAKITGIRNVKTGILTYLAIQNNTANTDFDFSKAKFSNSIQVFITDITTTTAIDFIMPDENSGVSRFNRIRAYNSKVKKWDFKNIGISNEMWLYDNRALQSVKLSPINNLAVSDFRMYNNSNFTFDFNGATGLLSANNCVWLFYNNGWPAATVNKFLYDCNAIATSGYTGRSINVGGSNADPDNSSGGYDGLAAKAALEGKGFTITI